MTKVEIWEALELERRTLIQAHVQLNEALDQVEKLTEKIRQDIEKELTPARGDGGNKPA